MTLVTLYDIDISTTVSKEEITQWLVSHEMSYELDEIDMTDFSWEHDTAFVYSFKNPSDATLFTLRWS